MPWESIEISKQDERIVKNEFEKKARFLIDEDLDGELTGYPRDEGWNVKGVSEAGLSGQEDNKVLAFAWKEKRIILTNDTKFPQGRGFVEQGNPGILILPDAPLESMRFTRALVNALNITGRLALAYVKTRWIFNSDGTLSITNRNKNNGKIETSRYQLEENGRVSIWKEN
jgi:predicted nuclease of predicted toxin-antitoxin system